MVMDTKNYTLGRGKFYFSRFIANTQTPSGFVYFGNTPELNLTIEAEMLDHFSSDEGVREKDDSIPLQINRTGTLITDNIAVRNIALFYFGNDSVVTTVAATGLTETINDVLLGRSYRLGQGPTNPTGYFGIDTTGFAVKKGATTYVLNTDYTVDWDVGLLNILETGAIVSGDDITVEFAVKASTRERVISGTSPVEGAALYKAQNPKGKNFHYYIPYLRLSPNGDYALKGDEWQQIPYSLDIQKRTGYEAIYVDGTPIFA